MNQDETISITSEDSANEAYVERRSIFEPVIRRVVDALGGHEHGKYRLGDSVSGCLKDLKKLWRKDDTDDERTVARIFWETRVLSNDLIPILLATAGQGQVEDKRAIACADLMAAMTWPIDMAEELKELDDELDQGTDYTQLLLSHRNYKAALLRPGVMKALLGIVLPPLAKTPKERTTRDGQVVNVILYLIRNLAFIKDLPPNMNLSTDQAEYSSLQRRLVIALSETHTFELLLTISANTSNDPLFTSWNTLVLEIFYLLFRGVKASSLVSRRAELPSAPTNLQSLLQAEERGRRQLALNAPSRHSRFGTTITIQIANKEEPVTTSQPLVLHRQQAINREAGGIMDLSKRQKTKKGNKLDELAWEDDLSFQARHVLQNLAREFIESCFNPFLCALLKDIKSERPKITEKDNLRLLYLTKWFLEFFLSLREKENGDGKWSFVCIAEVIERSWIIWVLRRIRQAAEEMPKLWTELQTGIECLTQFLLLIDSMSSSDSSDPTLTEAAEVIQQQLIYNGEVLDLAFESLRSYKEGKQSLAYLDSSIYLAYALFRMLERWGKTKGDMYVRKKKRRRKRSKGPGAEEDGVEDIREEEPDEPEEEVHETMFTFEAFEMKFAHPEITHTLLTYLSRYKSLTSENMHRVLSLLHRQAVRAKAEGLFFKASTLELFKSILADEKSLPRERPYNDLIKFINFILRRFFKALAEEPFLAVEAFFPKNRGQWKHFSSWEPEEKIKKDKKQSDTVRIKKGHSWSDQIGIAIALLVENGDLDFVTWTKDILMVVIEMRQKIIDETNVDEDEVLSDAEEVPKMKGVPPQALAKMTDYLIPYINNEQAIAARNPQLKHLFQLAKFSLKNEGEDQEPEWYVPAGLVPSKLQSILVVIDQFLETPYDLKGKKASELLSKSRRQRRRRSPSPVGELPSDDDELRNKKREKKKKEKEEYKSAVLIEDSDAEYGDMNMFLEKEKKLREKTARMAAQSGGIGTMKPTGTKKRRKKADTGVGKKRKGNNQSALGPSHGEVENETSEVEESATFSSRPRGSTPAEGAGALAKERPRPRPRPRPRLRAISNSSSTRMDASGAEDSAGEGARSAVDVSLGDSRPARVGRRVVLSDEE